MKPRIFDTSLMAMNILRVYDMATEGERVIGMTWYQTAHDFCEGLSLSVPGVMPTEVSRVMAALSPACKWRRNMADTENMIRAYASGGLEAAKAVSCATYGANKAKAIRILGGDMFALSGRKVLAFAGNIMFPEDSTTVTIDRHAWNVCVGNRYIIHDKYSVDRKMYEAAVEAYQMAARSIGILPSQMQAITWLTWRRLIGEGRED